jgi:MFS superfamily sulfate permease-like transporter
MLNYISPGVLIISTISLIILILWETTYFKKFKFTKLVQGPLVAVAAGILLNKFFLSIPNLAISKDHLVSIPISDSFGTFINNFTFPDFTALSNPDVYVTAIIIAVVASLETLLCVEASDKQDTLKRITPTNRELKAQGVGNIISGLIGGLPITQVIVRSSANQQSGGKTKASTVFHGILLLLSIIIIPDILNLIPLGTLAAILLVVGFKLAKPALFKKMRSQGKGQLAPFLVTIAGIIFTDLLIGISLGLVVAVSIILYNNFRIPYRLQRQNLEGKENIKILLSEDVTFLNKASIQRTLGQIPDNTSVVIDATNTHFIHCDVIEIIEDFAINAKIRDIEVALIDLYKCNQTVPLDHIELANGSK